MEMIILEDFNVVLDSRMDRSKFTSTPGLPNQFHKYMEELKVIDVWREKNKT